ncbi:MAG: T9SS type A sorting domain-containing protein [Candidatus Methylacidiphilales bacterium]
MNTKYTNKLLLLLLILLNYSKIGSAQFIKSINNNPTLSSTTIVEYYNKDLLLYITNINTLISKDGGKSFDVLNNRSPSSTQFVNDSTFINVVTYGLSTTTDQGKNWSNTYFYDTNGDTLKKYTFLDLCLFKNGKGFVTGFSTTLKPKMFLTNNFGTTWLEADTLKNNFSLLNNIKVIRTNNKKRYSFESISYKLRGGSDSLIIKYLNYGDSALEIDLSKHGIIEPIRSYAFKSEDTAIFITNSSLPSKKQIIYITTNGCNSFTKLNEYEIEFASIEYAKATKLQKGFFIGNLKGGGTTYSFNNGETWIKNVDPTVLETLNFFDAETGLAKAGYDIYFFGGLTNNIEEKINVNKINIYPNPVNNILNFSNVKGNVNFTIFNIQGQLLLNGTSLNNQIDVSSIPTGFYILNIESAQGKLVNKFIKSE